MQRTDTRRPVPPGLLFPALLLIVTAACRREGPPRTVILGPEQPLARSATDAVNRFHAALSRGQYADLCKASESHAFSGSSSLPCPLFLAYVHDHLGNVVETKRTQLPVAEDRRAGEPVRVGLDYATHYERGEAREHFEWRIDGVQTILIGYRVESDVLSR
jgi:hypothetical protein